MKQKRLLRNSLKFLSTAICLCMLYGIVNAQTVTNNTQGTHEDYFYSFWNDGQSGSASMTLGPGGNYSTVWNNINNFTAGKGWKTGKPDRAVCFEGSFNGGSNGFLAVYGWTKDPLIEYYVVESYGQWTPPGNTSDIIHKGSFTSDGGTYNIYVSTRTNQPSIVGTATFQQYWSVRTTKRSSGTVTFANHVAEWKRLGMNLGTTWDYQIMESEGYKSSGSSNITVKECVSCATPAPTATLSYDYEVGEVAARLTASGTALKWYSGASSTTPLSGAPTPSTAEVGTTRYYVSQILNGCEGQRTEITVRVSRLYKIFKVPASINIDGVIDPEWEDENVEKMNAGIALVGSNISASDLSGYAKMLWDGAYLYVLADITDDSKRNDSENNYEDDGIEIYIDINNDKATSYGPNDFQYTFGWNDGAIVGVRPDGASNAGIIYTVADKADGYLIEARIPWATLGGSPSAEQWIGVDFMINDDDDGGGRDGKLSWHSPTDEAYRDPSLFGTGKLVEQDVVTGSESFSSEVVTIFPNPALDELYVTGLRNNFDFAILDYSGRVVLEGRSAGKINITALESGIYILRTRQGEHAKLTKISKM